MISTIPYIFEQTLKRLPDKAAIFEENQSITFMELHQAALSSACALKDLGIRKGDRVGICMNKTIDQAIAILGAMYANAVFVPILPKLKHSNIEHIIKNSEMTAVITDAGRLEEVSRFNDIAKIIIGHGDVQECFASLPYLRKHIQPPHSFFEGIGQDNAAIIYSSGSTGRPKGIVISHRNLYDGARIVSTYLGTVEDDRIAGVLSFNFDYGLNQLWQTLLLGSSLYLHDLVFPSDCFALLSKNKITVLPLMPVIIFNLFNPRLYRSDPTHDFSSLRYICSSGGRVTPHMLNNLKQCFPNADIVLMYGLTEAFRSTYLPPELLEQHPTSIGKAIPDCEVFVFNEKGKECAPGKPGELVHRGGCISKGYWHDPEQTRKRFKTHPEYPGEMLVYSGDLVKRDEQGLLYFISRMDDMIKTHGYRVSPSEIEYEALKIDGITEAISFGVINPEIGEDIVLAYTSKELLVIDESKILQCLKETLPNYMVPRYMVYMKHMKSTGNEGKIDRVAVKAFSCKQLGISI